MFSRTSTRRRRTGQSSIAVVLGGFLLYVISYGPVLAYCIHTQQPGSFKAINAVMTIYRPLALVAPESFMREYTRLCGFSQNSRHSFLSKECGVARICRGFVDRRRISIACHHGTHSFALNCQRAGKKDIVLC